MSEEDTASRTPRRGLAGLESSGHLRGHPRPADRPARAQLGEQASGAQRARLELFGGTEMAVVGSERIRTENNCVPRDIVSVGRHLLFGYNVFIGLRKTRRRSTTSSASITSSTARRASPFHLRGRRGRITPSSKHPQVSSADFQEVYEYYKEASLLQLRAPRGQGPGDLSHGRGA